MTWELFLLCLGVGISVGILSSMFGVGGGIIMVPFIVFAFDETQQVAEGTSLLVVVPTAIAGVYAHRKRGFIEADVALPVALTGVFGAFLGARVAFITDHHLLQSIFGVVTILVAIKLLRDAMASQSSATTREERIQRPPGDDDV